MLEESNTCNNNKFCDNNNTIKFLYNNRKTYLLEIVHGLYLVVVSDSTTAGSTTVARKKIVVNLTMCRMQCTLYLYLILSH